MGRYATRKRRAKRNMFGRKIPKKAIKTVNQLARVGLVERKQCPVFLGDGFWINNLQRFGSNQMQLSGGTFGGGAAGGVYASWKNPWAGAQQNRALLEPSDGYSVLSKIYDFGSTTTSAHYVPAQPTQANPTGIQSTYQVSQPMYIGVLPREETGPYRLGGVDGRCVFFDTLTLRMTVRYEGPVFKDWSDADIKLFGYHPPVKYSVMVVKEMTDRIGREYTRSLTGGNQVSDDTSHFVKETLEGKASMVGEALFIDELGQPFGIGKKPQWYEGKINTVLPPGVSADSTSINGNRTSSQYFHCKVNKKFYKVLQCKQGWLVPPAENHVSASAGLQSETRINSGSMRGRSSETFKFELPMKCRMEMTSSQLTPSHPRGAYQTTRPDFTNNPQAGSTVKMEEETDFPEPSSGPQDEYLVPSSERMSQYKLIVKAYCPTEDYETNYQRFLNFKANQITTPQTVTPNPPGLSGYVCPRISFGAWGKLDYSDV